MPMLMRLFVQTAAFLAFLGLCLFGPAGTWDWPGAWAFLAIVGACSLWIGLWLRRRDPALLAERMGSPIRRKQQGWDRVFMAMAGLGFYGWLAVMALDARRLRWSQVPPLAQVAGGVLIVLAFWGVAQVFAANSFASPVIKLQADRAQSVISTGPYRWVRHPMYAGATIFFLGAPLLLGSWWGLLFIPLIVPLMAARALGEERVLMEGLPGYAAYAARVKWRFLPGVW